MSEAASTEPQTVVVSRNVLAREREVSALRMAREGFNVDAIAKRLGITVDGARKCVNRALDRLTVEAAPDAARIKTMELQRLDFVLMRMMKIIRDPASDDERRIAATGRVLQIQDRRARYLGLDFRPKEPPKEKSPEQLAREEWNGLLRKATTKEIEDLRAFVIMLQQRKEIPRDNYNHERNRSVVVAAAKSAAVADSCVKDSSSPHGSSSSTLSQRR